MTEEERENDRREVEVGLRGTREAELRKAFSFLRTFFPNEHKIEGADCCEFDIRGREREALADYASMVRNETIVTTLTRKHK